MTLQNCKRLLKFYESLLDGTVVQPAGHKNWSLVLANAKVNAEAMRQRIAHKEKLPKYLNKVNAEVKDGKK